MYPPVIVGSFTRTEIAVLNGVHCNTPGKAKQNSAYVDIEKKKVFSPQQR